MSMNGIFQVYETYKILLAYEHFIILWTLYSTSDNFSKLYEQRWNNADENYLFLDLKISITSISINSTKNIC
jgi:hypothetical protein